MPRRLVLDPEPVQGGGLLPQLLYTLRPITDSDELAALGDQDDATYLDQPFHFSGPSNQDFGSSLGVASGPEPPLVNYLVFRLRGSLVTPPALDRYSDASIYILAPDNSRITVPVDMWPENSFAWRESGQITVDPSGNEWTMENLLTMAFYAHVLAQGNGTLPYPSLRVAELEVEVWGVPSEELATSKFVPGVYDLGLNDVRYIAHLTASEIKGVYETARASGVPLSLKALALDSGALIDRESSISNSDYSGMLSAIALAGGGGLTVPQEF